MSLEGRRLTLNDSITMIKEWINGALRPLGVRVTGPGPQTFEVDDGWPEERRYWEGQIRTYYQEQFGLGLHPLQTDSAIVPPVKLATTIQGANKADPDGFFASGYRTILGYLAELRDYGVSPTDMGRILEMGVELGRLMVHLFPFRAELHGCDVTAPVLEWTRSKLGQRIELRLTNLEPPLPYPDAHFDFVYANSVLTHIASAMMSQWAAELRRVVRPGGMVIVSVLDPNHYLRHLTYREYDSTYYRPGCHCWNLEAGVLMTSYQSREFLRSIFGAKFSILELRPHFRDTSHLICRRG
ncbi:MAG: class I SAM-dependent methyltransferase, partial [Acidobacteria bacterium]|nr:class I SAM-dependent methyltransferase [Acidobacteriota bacterium]